MYYDYSIARRNHKTKQKHRKLITECCSSKSKENKTCQNTIENN